MLKVFEVWYGDRHLSTLTYLDGGLQKAEAAQGCARLMLYMVAEDTNKLEELIAYTEEINATIPKRPENHTKIISIAPIVS